MWRKESLIELLDELQIRNILRADKKEKNTNSEQEWLSIQNKKFIDYNDTVLLPFIEEVRKQFGWNLNQPVPEWLTAISWSDGYIPQLQTTMFEA